MGIVPVLFFVPSVGGTYAEAIVASFHLISELPRARWAIVAVFISGLSMHKAEAGTRQSCIARQHQGISWRSQCS